MIHRRRQSHKLTEILFHVVYFVFSGRKLLNLRRYFIVDFAHFAELRFDAVGYLLEVVEARNVIAQFLHLIFKLIFHLGRFFDQLRLRQKLLKLPIGFVDAHFKMIRFGLDFQKGFFVDAFGFFLGILYKRFQQAQFLFVIDVFVADFALRIVEHGFVRFFEFFKNLFGAFFVIRQSLFALLFQLIQIGGDFTGFVFRDICKMRNVGSKNLANLFDLFFGCLLQTGKFFGIQRTVFFKLRIESLSPRRKIAQNALQRPLRFFLSDGYRLRYLRKLCVYFLFVTLQLFGRVLLLTIQFAFQRFFQRLAGFFHIFMLRIGKCTQGAVYAVDAVFKVRFRIFKRFFQRAELLAVFFLQSEQFFFQIFAVLQLETAPLVFKTLRHIGQARIKARLPFFKRRIQVFAAFVQILKKIVFKNLQLFRHAVVRSGFQFVQFPIQAVDNFFHAFVRRIDFGFKIFLSASPIVFE